ncbi:MAG: hypothetical protein R3B09_27680 [Nannocystaceae bacterium]
MTITRTILLTAASAGLWGALACDGPCDPSPESPTNQDPASLAECPDLPPGVDPIPGLAVARASPRFGGLMLTLSERALACGEPAAQHDYCGDALGLGVGLPAEEVLVGAHSLRSPVYVELERPDLVAVGGASELVNATVELFTVDEHCVTGRIVGLAGVGGPFDGGFRAPRCTP